MEYSQLANISNTSSETHQTHSTIPGHSAAYLAMDYCNRKGETVEKTSQNTGLQRNNSKLSMERCWRVEPYNYDWAESLQEVTGDQTMLLPDTPLACGTVIGSISSSLPTNIIHTTLTHSPTPPAVRVAEEQTASHGTPGKQVTSLTSLVSASSCQGLDSHSPVSRFHLPRLLRNSFSRIRGSIPLRSRSKSVDLLKNSSEIEDSELDTSCSDIISPIDEEMVKDSMLKGLPIIPFAYPSFVIVDKNLEDTKMLIRENSVKDLKHAFRGGKKYVNKEEERSAQDKSGKQQSVSGLDSSSLNINPCSTSQESPGAKSDYNFRHSNYSNNSSYVEMSPQDTDTQVPNGSFGDDPYMVMDITRDKRGKEDKHSYEETIFHLEQSNTFKEGKNYLPDECVVADKCINKTKSMFRRSEHKSEEDFDPLSSCERRQYKKGNKHKGDYAFIDLGKNKDYVNMGKTWKSLTFYKK